MSIPKIIHLVEPAHNVLSVWQNIHPDWQCIDWSLEACYAFIKRYYPDSEQTYLGYQTDAQRIHMSGYFLLHRYGGIVVIGNRIPKKRIEGLFLSVYDLYRIEDWFLASMPQTDFLQYAIDTLPTLVPKWYDRFLSEKALIQSTAWVEPDIPHKDIKKRVYQHYFHPLQETGVNKVRMVAVIVLIVTLIQFTRTIFKDTLAKWRNSLMNKRLEETPSPVEIPELTTLSIESLEKNLNLPMSKLHVPPIRIPPLNPSTPSSILTLEPSDYSDRSLLISPVSQMSDELVITI
jgi:hypothetical protein